MTRPRGTTGDIRGMEEAAASALVLALVEYVQKELSGTFTRAQLRKMLKERHGVGGEVAEGLIWAVVDLPFTTSEVRGVHRLDSRAALWAQHRLWRIPSGRIGVADALVIVRFVQDHWHPDGSPLPPGIKALYERCRKGLIHLGLQEELRI